MESPGIVGHITWDVRDRWGRRLGEGVKDILAHEIIVTRIESASGGPFYNKQLFLNEEFRFGLSDHPKRSELTGFGLIADLVGSHTFCWEWFSIKRDAQSESPAPMHLTARKIQEGGELSLTLREAQLGIEIQRLDFITDVSLRVSKFGLGSFIPLLVVKWPTWRIHVLKGSWVEWPPSR